MTTLQLGSFQASTYYSIPTVPPTNVFINNVPWLTTGQPIVFQSPYELPINSPGTMNFRIIRQPRVLLARNRCRCRTTSR